MEVTLVEEFRPALPLINPAHLLFDWNELVQCEESWVLCVEEGWVLWVEEGWVLCVEEGWVLCVEEGMVLCAELCLAQVALVLKLIKQKTNNSNRWILNF